MIRKSITGLAAALVLAAAWPALAANDGPAYGAASTWANLPQGVRFPEGITANPASGDIFVSTFDFGPNSNKLLRLGRNGNVIAQKDFGATPLLGLGFADGKVYILNFGLSALQRIDANFTESTPVDTLLTFPVIGAPGPRPSPNPDGSSDSIVFGSAGKSAPNGMAFDHRGNGNLYVSDSFQGAIFRVPDFKVCRPAPAVPCVVDTVSHDPQLATAGFPPFGANGLAFNAAETVLYIANTGDNRVLQMNVATSAVTPFAESVHGADGLVFHEGVLWVAANQADEIVGLDNRGRVVAKVGFFEGIRRDGTPRGLLFPASMVIVGSFMYVTNLALPLTSQVGDEPEEDVTRWNIARLHNPLH